MKIKVLTAHDQNLKQIADLNIPILKKYCEKQNYELVIRNIENFDKPQSWFKVPTIIEEFNKKDCDYILWIDTDTLILNQDFRIESLLVPNKYFFVAKDANGINCGVFIIQNNDYMIDILNQVYSLYPTFINHGWWEQAAIMHLMWHNYNNFNNYVEYVPQNILNAYDPSLLATLPDGYVNENSFILHLPSIRNDIRYSTIEQYIEKYYGSS